MPNPIERVTRTVWKGDTATIAERVIPGETPIAITYGGSTQAVMMATSADFEDFAVGFSVTEGLISSPDDIVSLEVVEEDEGIELRMWLKPELAEIHSRRRRLLAGPTGCGLCGIESLTEAVKPTAKVGKGIDLRPQDIRTAMEDLPGKQTLNAEAKAIHAAGFWTPAEGFVAVREDVGRHNALDKLVGHLARTGRNGAEGAIILTSRVSVEMVQKTAVLGAGALVAVSAPTALAVRIADEAGITLAAIARGDSFEVYTHPGRIVAPKASSAA